MSKTTKTVHITGTITGFGKKCYIIDFYITLHFYKPFINRCSSNTDVLKSNNFVMWPLLKHDCTLNATKQKSSLSSANKVVLVYKYKSIIRSKRYDLWHCKFSEMGRVVWASERSAIYLKRYQNWLRNLTDAFVSARSVHPIPQNSDL